jgi:hypothetical protein
VNVVYDVKKTLDRFIVETTDTHAAVLLATHNPNDDVET